MEAEELYKKIKELQELQENVDSNISVWDKSHIKTALMTEFAEWYNTVELFKDWKKNKGKPLELQLDELADCLAFTLSLMNNNSNVYTLPHCKSTIRKFDSHYDIKKLKNILDDGYLFYRDLLHYIFTDKFTIILEIILEIAEFYYSLDDLFTAYYNKSQINIERQRNGY